MFPIIWRVMSRYAPYITLPVAAIVGVVGYNLENILSDKYTPGTESISQTRTKRLLEKNGTSADQLTEDALFYGVLERNLSPSLQKTPKMPQEKEHKRTKHLLGRSATSSEKLNEEAVFSDVLETNLSPSLHKTQKIPQEKEHKRTKLGSYRSSVEILNEKAMFSRVLERNLSPSLQKTQKLF